MSYEGEVVKVCANGHYEINDSYASFEDPCHTCGAEWKHEGHIDETNCLPYPLTFELHQLTPLIRHKCPVCNKTHETTEETYEFKDVELYWSEDGNFIKTTMKPVDRIMCQVCSDHCKCHLAMSEFIDALIAKEPKYSTMVECFFQKHGVDYHAIPEAALYRYKKRYSKTFDMTKEQCVSKCCNAKIKWRLVTLCNESTRIPFCEECGKQHNQ